MFGKMKERRRQWSLLGVLLMDLGVLDALGFMESAFGARAVDWTVVRQRAANGRTLLEIAKDGSMPTPPEVLEALGAGEADGRLPERLAALAPQTEFFTGRSEEDAGVVALVNRLFREAIEQGAAGLLLSRSLGGEGELKILRGEVWTPHSRYGAQECGALVRRIWILARQPYWSPKAGVIRVPIPPGTVEFRLTPGLQGGLGIEIVSL